jgi:hypothetical protein
VGKAMSWRVVVRVQARGRAQRVRLGHISRETTTECRAGLCQANRETQETRAGDGVRCLGGVCSRESDDDNEHDDVDDDEDEDRSNEQSH